MDISKVEERALVPLGGALVRGSSYRYNIQLVASKKYYSRPYYEFTSDQVLIDEKSGVLQFTARPAAIQNFIWNMVLVKDGKGNPVGLYADVYVEAYRKTKRFAMAHLTGHIVTCNNVGPEVGYVIKVQAESDIKVEYYD
jgi:hypothetical protein